MRHVLALDIGGTNIRAALMNDQYEIIRLLVTETIIGNRDAFLIQIKQLIDQLNDSFSDISAIACGVPGRVDVSGRIEVLPNIKIFEVPLKQFLEDTYHLPVTILNDAVMAAIAEGNLGFGKNLESSYFMTISTGIGAAYIRHHRLHFSSEEIGHMLIPYLGSFYEFESLASGTGIVKLAALNKIYIDSAKTFFLRVSQHDPLVLPIYKDWLKMIQNFLLHIDRYYQPKAIIFTGGVLKSSTIFWDDLVQTVPHIALAHAQFGQNAGLMGAANVALSSTD